MAHETRDFRVRDRACNGRVIFKVVVIEDTRDREGLGDLEVIVVVGQRHLGRALGMVRGL